MNEPLHHSIEDLHNAVGNQIRDIKDKIAADDQQLMELKEQGLIYAGTWMKAGKYMYLIYPSDGFGYRKREYIGADPQAMLRATQGIERAREYDNIKTKRRHLQERLNTIEHYLRMAEKNGDRWIQPGGKTCHQ